MSIMASIQRVCPGIQAEFGDEPVPVNDGSSVKLTDPKLFLYGRRGFYKYVGPSDSYSGPIRQKPNGSKKLLASLKSETA